MFEIKGANLKSQIKCPLRDYRHAWHYNMTLLSPRTSFNTDDINIFPFTIQGRIQTVAMVAAAIVRFSNYIVIQ